MRDVRVILRENVILHTIEPLDTILEKLRAGAFVAIPLDTSYHLGASSAIINPAHVMAVTA